MAGIKSCIGESNPNHCFHALLDHAWENSLKKERGLVVDETTIISPIAGSKPPMYNPLFQLLIDVEVRGGVST